MRTKIDTISLFQKKQRRSVVSSIGEKVDDVCRIIERENRDIDGVLTNTKYNGKKKIS